MICKIDNTQIGSSLVLGALTLNHISTIEIIQRMIQVQWNTNKLDALEIGSTYEHSIRREAHTCISTLGNTDDPSSIQLALVVLQ